MSETTLRGVQGDLPAAPTPRDRGRWAWPLLAVAVTVVVAALRLTVTPAFYFADDTQTGTAGQWWELGRRLLSGEWPLLNPHAWTAGNYMAEGQWGLLNPLIWLFAIITRLSGDVQIAVTAIKIVMLGMMALGVHLLARSYGARAPWAAAAGVLVPLGGFTVYIDAPSWTTGLLASAVLPWAWWGLRRVTHDGRGPLQYLVAAGVLVTFGYVFGVIVLILVLAEALVSAAVSRDRVRVVRVLVAGIYAGLLAVAVYLPGILTAPVTVRATNEVLNTGFLNADLTDLLSVSSAVNTASVGAWYGSSTPVPLLYVLWALPALALMRCSRERLRSLLPLLIVGGVLLLVITGPDQVGPIRWPVRFMPYLTTVVVIVFVVIASELRKAASSRLALVGSIAVAVAAAWFTIGNTPWQWREALLMGAVQVVGILLLWALLYRPRQIGRGALGRVPAPVAMATITAAVGAFLVAPQMYLFPATPLPKLAGVDRPDAAAGVPGDVPGDAIVVGDIYAGWAESESFTERLAGNQWYFSDTKVSSLYTVLPYRAYVSDLCADLRGSTCAEALTRILSEDETTGEQVAALLGVNTIIVIPSTFRDGLPDLPDGWRLSHTGQATWVIQRTDPVPTAGGVAWMSPGTTVTTESQDETRVVLRVDSVGDQPAVVLSRLAWPGYTVAGAEQGASVRDYLLTLDLTGAESGETITVEFRPPGWPLVIVGVLAAVGILVVWPVAAARHRGRKVRHADAA